MTLSAGKQDGFTLIEVLIALTIFAVGVLAVATMQAQSIRYNATARLTSEGVFKGERRVEELLAGTYAAAAVGTVSATNGPHTVSSTIADQVTHKTIVVTVTWKDSSGNKSFTLNSLKGNF